MSGFCTHLQHQLPSLLHNTLACRTCLDYQLLRRLGCHRLRFRHRSGRRQRLGLHARKPTQAFPSTPL